MNLTSPSSSSTSRKSKSRKTRNCCSLAVSSSVSSLVPPSSDDTPLSRTSIMSKSPHDEKITWSEETRGFYTCYRQPSKVTYSKNINSFILHKYVERLEDLVRVNHFKTLTCKKSTQNRICLKQKWYLKWIFVDCKQADNTGRVL